ncbi:MAG: glutathione S-transferase family protein [Cyanobacteriota bacterium]|nr:glutathione S-transferase family protein [Cyanobacteriota bacterium]
MLKFYYNPISANARRVWVALLEKQIPFEPILIDLGGEQFSDEFTAVNPLQRIPVIIDDGFRVVESLAILDYLEAKYFTPSLMPIEVEAIATVRMVENVALNDLQPTTLPLTRQAIGLEVDSHKVEQARQRVERIMQFFESLLQGRKYFVSERLTLADIVAGTLVSALPLFGFSMDAYPSVDGWMQRLEARESWQQTAIKPEMIQAALPKIREIIKRRS